MEENFKQTFEILIGIIIAVLLIGNSIVDLKRREISLKLSLGAAMLGTTIIWAANLRSISFIGLGLIPGLFMVLAAIFSKGKVGMGDAIVIMALGLLWGLQATFEALLLALVITGLISIIMLAAKKWQTGTRLPFIPFLCGASGLVALARELNL